MTGTRTWPDSLHSLSCRCQRMGRGPPPSFSAGRARKILAGLLNYVELSEVELVSPARCGFVMVDLDGMGWDGMRGWIRSRTR
jgi:hypothetical protein